MHGKGITIGNEPGGILAKRVQDAVNTVVSSPDMPARWSFMVDRKTKVGTYPDDQQAITESEKLGSRYGGMTSLTPKAGQTLRRWRDLLAAHAGAPALSRRTQGRLDDGRVGLWPCLPHHWDAGYQLHIHVNGDAGLDRVLGTLEANLRRNPRQDHRTVLAHFAVSAPDQVARIRQLGAIVGGVPYCVSALADQYAKVGLGPERADEMVRLGDLNRAGMRWSLHSDLPMAPADPLFLICGAVNRVTASGRVAVPDQRGTVEEALRGVTFEAACSLKLEDEIGTISPGKRSNFTILAENPLAADPAKLRDISVWGRVMEGRIFPASGGQKKASLDRPMGSSGTELAFAEAAINHAFRMVAHGAE